jgi:hypothetical protein
LKEEQYPVPGSGYDLEHYFGPKLDILGFAVHHGANNAHSVVEIYERVYHGSRKTGWVPILLDGVCIDVPYFWKIHPIQLIRNALWTHDTRGPTNVAAIDTLCGSQPSLLQVIIEWINAVIFFRFQRYRIHTVNVAINYVAFDISRCRHDSLPYTKR